MKSIAVIGAGVVGLSSATFLQRAGFQVTLIDGMPVGSGASYGNAGMISVDSTVPMAMPGMLRKVPKWLMDPTGPLFVDPKYFLTALPWLLRWTRAGRIDKVRTSSAALHALHGQALIQYRELLGQEHFNDLIRTTGQIHIWDSVDQSVSERVARELRDSQGIVVQALTPDELHDYVPELNRSIKRALLYPRNGNAVNPLRLMQTIAHLFSDAGGHIVQQRVMRIFPQQGRFRVLTNMDDHEFDRVVVAAGAWSRRLLEPLGLSFPLETERGYHIEIRQPNIKLNMPLLHKGRGFSASPMETGIRFAGTVEIAGLDAPPNEQRGRALLAHAKNILPNLEFDAPKLWMGYRPSLPDSVPIIDESNRHPGLYVACGHGHTGLTGGAITGRLISELVAQSQTTIDPAPYRMSRF
ncbi:FAD-dependent oxidoreductase [Pollutimonas bauzanensis]|uniref:NAD(P)/FAD-dependent oxidoreductase n=1 Tax=Pollutimonas bauzanensis TaxID=658167 RepID=UPI00334228C2